MAHSECVIISSHHWKYLIWRYFCTFFTVFPPRLPRVPCICCTQSLATNQKPWSCLQASGVSPTSSFPSASHPVTGLFASGLAPPLCRIWNRRSSSSCQRLLRRWSWSPWGEEPVEVHWGPWRTGQPLPVLAQTTGGSVYVPFRITPNDMNDILILNENQITYFICSYMRTLSLR